MNLEILIKLASTLAIVLSFALNLYLFFKARADDRFERITDRADRMAKALSEEIQERREESSRLERNHAVLEARVDALPTHDDLGAIREAISLLAKNVASVDQRSVTTLNSVHRIENYLLERRP